MSECRRCRDWGKYERHEDHAPGKSPQPFEQETIEARTKDNND